MKEICLTCQFEVDFILGLGKKWPNTHVVLGAVMMPGLSESHLSSVEGQLGPQTI